MSYFRKGQADARVPECEVLPDARKRVTCYRLVTATDNIAGDLANAYGTLYPYDSEAPSGWTGLRLVDRKVTDDPNTPGKDTRPLRVLVYEQLPATAEIQVGNNTQIALEDGRAAVEANFLQLVAGSYVAGTVGSDTAPGDASAYLQTVRTTDDGTLRRITRTYVHSGTISTDDESLQGGALLKKTIMSVKDVPSTPSGYTLVGSPVQSPGGLPVYTYSYYKGSGEVSRRYELTAAGPNNEPGDAAAQGVNTVTIVHLTAPSVSTQPTSNPNNVCALRTIGRQDQDGYRVWTIEWVNGSVVDVVTETVTSQNGKLINYRCTGYGVQPSTPIATIGGTVTAVGHNVRKGDGFLIYDYTWAEGFGEVSRSTSYGQSSAGDGSVGSTTIEIVHLTAPGASDPTSAPSGCVKVLAVPSEQEGYRVWRVTYGKGAGLVVSTNDAREGGKLVLYHRVALGSAPSAPSATIGGTVTATGTGYREEAGYKVYDYTWAEGLGVIAEDKITRTDGLMEWHQTILSADTLPITASTFDTAWKPTTNAVLYRLRPQLQDGYTVSEAAWMVAGDGTSAPTAATVATEAWRPFTWPGRAKTYTASFGGYVVVDVFLSPPVTGLVLATTTISYQTSNAVGSLSPALWNPTDYATMRASFVAVASSNNARSIVKGLEGYTSNGGSTVTFTAGNPTTLSVLGELVYFSTAGSVVLSGGPTSPDGTTALTLHAEVEQEAVFVKYDGTKYYRCIKITATPAAQTALPV